MVATLVYSPVPGTEMNLWGDKRLHWQTHGLPTKFLNGERLVNWDIYPTGKAPPDSKDGVSASALVSAAGGLLKFVPEVGSALSAVASFAAFILGQDDKSNTQASNAQLVKDMVKAIGKKMTSEQLKKYKDHLAAIEQALTVWRADQVFTKRDVKHKGRIFDAYTVLKNICFTPEKGSLQVMVQGLKSMYQWGDDRLVQQLTAVVSYWTQWMALTCILEANLAFIANEEAKGYIHQEHLNAGAQAGKESKLGTTTNAALDEVTADTAAIAEMKLQAFQEATNYLLRFYGDVEHVGNTVQEIVNDLGSWATERKLWRFRQLDAQIVIPNRFAGTYGFEDAFTKTTYSYWLDRGLWGGWDINTADPDLWNNFRPNLKAYMEQFHSWMRAELLAKVSLEFAVLEGRQRCLEFFSANIASCNTREDHHSDLWAYLLSQFKTQEEIDGCIGRWTNSVDALKNKWSEKLDMPDGPALYNQLTAVKQGSS